MSYNIQFLKTAQVSLVSVLPLSKSPACLKVQLLKLPPLYPAPPNNAVALLL